jgi:hypothetical protein
VNQKSTDLGIPNRFRLNSSRSNAALKDPATQAKLKPLEAQAMFGSPADYAAFLVSELPKWTAMAKLSGAAAE